MPLAAERVPGREPITIVEIDVDRCALVYGETPCEAALGVTGDQKCFNALKHCQDPDNYSPFVGSPKSRNYRTLRFAVPSNALPRNVTLIPSVISVSTRPTRLNIGGQDPNYGALGRRAEVTISFADHVHRDLLVDPYLSERTYDPLSRGTFWTKFLARNPYYQNRPLRILEGYVGQSLNEMQVRRYVIDRLDGPDGDGIVTLVGKDILSLAENERALVPGPSSGRLLSILKKAEAFATLTPAGIGNSDYPAAGIARIGSELMGFVRSGDSLTFTGRGLRGSGTADHVAGETVQLVYVADAISIPDILASFLEDYAGVPGDFIPTDEWAAESLWLAASRVSAWITEPTGVDLLVGEITSQANCMLWWDERQQKIRLLPFRPPMGDEVVTLDADAHIIADSFETTEDPAQRVSRVEVYFRPRNPAASIEDANNYRRRKIYVDANAEGADQYGEQRSKTILSRWLVNDGQAISLAKRLVKRGRDNPPTVVFELDAKDRALWTGDLVDIQHPKLVDETGAPRTVTCIIVESDEVKPGHRVRYEAVPYVFPGRYGIVLAAESPSYGDATPEQKLHGAWVSADEEGFSDGQPPYAAF